MDTLNHRWMRLLPPGPVLALVGWMLVEVCVSLSHNVAPSTAGLAIARQGVPLLLGAFACRLFARELTTLRGLGALLCWYLIVLGLAVFRYRTGGEVTAGGFSTPAAFGGFLALTLPFVLAGALVFRPAVVKTGFIALFVAGLLVSLDGPAHLGILIGALVLLAATVRPRAPLLPHATTAGRISIWALLIALAALALWHHAVEPRTRRDNGFAHFDDYSVYEEDGTLRRRVADEHALFSMGRENGFGGVGLGAAPLFIAQYYHDHSDPQGDPQLDQCGQFHLLYAECGLIGVLLFIAALAAPLARIGGSPLSPSATILRLAHVAAFAGFAVTCLSRPLLSGATAALFGFLSALESSPPAAPLARPFEEMV